MSYNPITDFLALIRNTGGTASVAEMPGLDYVVAAMARAGFFQLWTGQAAPTVNQASTVWLKPSVPSWVAEGTVYLWNASTGVYVPATQALWSAVLGSKYVFQSVNAAAGVVNPNTTLLAIQRNNPGSTAIMLPFLALASPLRVTDWSIGVVNHAITLTTPDGATIMQQPFWTLLSSPVQLAGLSLSPSIDLNGWVIAP